MDGPAELRRNQDIIGEDTMIAERCILDHHLSSGGSTSDHGSASQPQENVQDLERASLRKPEDSRGLTVMEHFRSERRERLARKLGMRNRFIGALCGGLSVIAPMLIMAINPSQIKTLVTASVAVLLFSIGLAWRSSARIDALLATTAAYAAVMVVFVGVNSEERFRV